MAFDPVSTLMNEMKLIEVISFCSPSTVTADSAMRGIFFCVFEGELKSACSTFRAPKLNTAHEETPFWFCLVIGNPNIPSSFSQQKMNLLPHKRLFLRPNSGE